MKSHLRVFFGIPLGRPHSEGAIGSSKKIKGLGEDDLDIYLEKHGPDNRLRPGSEGQAGLFDVYGSQEDGAMVFGVYLGAVDLGKNTHHLELDEIFRLFKPAAQDRAAYRRALKELPAPILAFVQAHATGEPRRVAMITHRH